ncbi:hypothetical protein [Halochromatium glycolicum]|uniref:PEP-CTERM protein-sorting domain-containing protein n=1 Tax=Halochromatium glycolicum TaxID=85075 RepID=A0AAJ0X9E0_9GAMM|nr:hypothetical protein [Halochromatium glycolicum]MBK1703612.1 hypothetical protein [Halochromatium glycolicum]
MTRAFTIIRSALAGLVVAMTSLGAAQAAPIAVTFDGTDYTIGTLTGVYNDTPTASLLQSQPWWDNTTLAQGLAAALGNQLGVPNFGSWGPLFAYSLPVPNAALTSWYFSPSGPGVNTVTVFPGSEFVFAVDETPAAVPLPPTAALLLGGLGVVGVMKRRARKAA